MTSPERSLHPARRNDRGSLLSALEFVACGGVQLAQIVGTVVGQCVSLEPRPQIFDGIEVGGIRGKKSNLNVPVQPIEIVAHQAAAMCLQTIPDHQQRLLEMGLECFEQFDDLFLAAAALVQPEQTVGVRDSGNHRDVIPVEVKLDDGRLTLERPGAHARGALANAGLVYEDDQSAFSPGFFLRAGQILRFQLRTASSSRSMARFSGFCTLKPKAPRIRQICVWPNLTSYSRSISTPTRLSVQSSVPKPCSVGFCRMARRKPSNWDSSSLAGRPLDGTLRNASIPPSSSKAFHVYTVCRATPTSSATSVGFFPLSSSRPARNRFLVASSDLLLTMPHTSRQFVEDITRRTPIGCHVLRKYQ